MSFRLERVEAGLKELRDAVAGVREHVDDRLDRVQGSIASLQFVNRDVYEANRRNDRDYSESTREKAERAVTVSMWALGIVVSTAIAGLIGLLRLAG